MATKGYQRDDEIRVMVATICAALRLRLEDNPKPQNHERVEKFARELATDILEAAECNGLGGCILCQG